MNEVCFVTGAFGWGLLLLYIAYRLVKFTVQHFGDSVELRGKLARLEEEQRRQDMHVTHMATRVFMLENPPTYMKEKARK